MTLISWFSVGDQIWDHLLQKQRIIIVGSSCTPPFPTVFLMSISRLSFFFSILDFLLLILQQLVYAVGSLGDAISMPCEHKIMQTR